MSIKQSTKKITMQQHNEKLVEEYEQNEKKLKKHQIITVVLEFIMVAIVVGIKSIQKTASLRLNIIATSSALFLLAVHFWNFYPRRHLIEKKVKIVLDGLEMEKQNSSSSLIFFQNYLKKFNVLEQILNIMIFDIMLLYFFSVSYTQLIKAINPEIIVKLRALTPISTFVINIVLGLAYYKPFRPILQAKKLINL